MANKRIERVLGVTLIYVNTVVIFFTLVAFISISPLSNLIEDLSWGYIEDHKFSAGDQVYVDWCRGFFNANQCTSPLKVSGYFGLRSATLTFRAWDQFHGNYSLRPVTKIIKYSSSRAQCAIPYGETCDVCEDRATAASTFIFILLVLQVLALIDQLRDQIIGKSSIRAYGVHTGIYVSSFILSLMAYLAMRYGCIEEIPMTLKYGPIAILIIAVIIISAFQAIIEHKWLGASSSASEKKVEPMSDEKPAASTDKWSAPPTRSSIVSSSDPFVDKQDVKQDFGGPKAPARLPGHVPTPPSSPPASDVFDDEEDGAFHAKAAVN